MNRNCILGGPWLMSNKIGVVKEQPCPMPQPIISETDEFEKVKDIANERDLHQMKFMLINALLLRLRNCPRPLEAPLATQKIKLFNPHGCYRKSGKE